MIAKGGKQYYGEAIGIAIFDDLRHAMIPGDVGNASTYDFPVFDYIGFINMLYQSVVQKRYRGIL